eukprot:gene562-1219_t
MSCKVYVGGLPWACNADELKQVCSKYGAIEDAFIVMDKTTEIPRSKGFGFVTFQDANEAAECQRSLNGSEYGGRILKVGAAHKEMAGNPNQRQGNSYENSGSRYRGPAYGGGYSGGSQGYGGQGYGAAYSGYGGSGAGAYASGGGYGRGYSGNSQFTQDSSYGTGNGRFNGNEQYFSNGYNGGGASDGGGYTSGFNYDNSGY